MNGGRWGKPNWIGSIGRKFASWTEKRTPDNKSNQHGRDELPLIHVYTHAMFACPEHPDERELIPTASNASHHQLQAPVRGTRVTFVTVPSLAERFRADFPILDQTVNGHPLVYLDNAASTQRPTSVIDELSRYYRQDHANVHRGLHALSTRATILYENARQRVANYLNAEHAESIIFTRGTTEAINLVASSWAGNELKPRDGILLTQMEHHANLIPWQIVAKR